MLLARITELKARHDQSCEATRAIEAEKAAAKENLSELRATLRLYAAQEEQLVDSERALREQAERQRAERGTVQSVLSEARENLRLAADVQRELEAAERQTRSELVRISDGLYQAVFVQHGPAAADRLFCEEKTLELARDEAARLLAAARAALDAAQAKRLVEQQEIEAAAHAAADETVALTARLDTLRRQKLEIQIELKERRLFAKLLDTRDRLENEFFDKLHRHRLGLAHNLVVAGNQPPLDLDAL